MKKFLFAFLMIASIFFLTILSITGCQNNSANLNGNDIYSISLSNGNFEDIISTPQKWHITNKRLCVLFGYNFNTPEIVEQFTALLGNEFGLDDNGGLILPIIYPESFKHGVKSYSNDFLSILQDDELDLCGVILLGAPEKTHTALAKNQDKWNQNVPYPIISFFPQDDILGSEATCDIVIDMGQTATDSEIAPEEQELTFISDSPALVLKAIEYMLTMDSSFSIDSSLQTHVSQMFPDTNIHHYTDPETGLQSINHFVLN